MGFLNSIGSILSNQVFVLIAVSISFLLKLFVITFTFKQQAHTKIAQQLRFLLLVILGISVFSDISWIQEI